MVNFLRWSVSWNLYPAVEIWKASIGSHFLNLRSCRRRQTGRRWAKAGQAGAYRPYRKCGMAGGDVPRGAPSGKIKKNWKESSRAAREGLWTEVRECGGDRSPQGQVRSAGGPGTARVGPDTVRGGVMQIFFGHPKTTRLIGICWYTCNICDI